MPRLDEVFTLNGVPTYTFVQPSEYNRLFAALRSPGRGIVLEGPSGIGKTTAITKAVEALRSESHEVAELSARKPRDIEYIENIHDLGYKGIVIIDDFHKLTVQQQQGVSDYLKILADTSDANTKLVIVGINNAGTRLVKLAPDLHARVEVIRLEANSNEKVTELVELGEAALNIKLEDKEKLVANARGSFYLAQMLGYELCLQQSVLDTQPNVTPIEISVELVKTKLYNKLKDRFQDATRTFVRGMKFQKEGRAPYYQVLRWLAESGDWSIDLNECIRNSPAAKGSVGQIIQKGFLGEFVDLNRESFEKLLHYDSESNTLTIEDPQFLFFLRETIWPELAADAGFTNVARDHPYDFALSFAGSNRSIARKIATALQDLQLSVFYDEFEQSRILAENVEEYLRPIYQTQANYVIVILSPDYPTRVWTKFESDQFKVRFGEHKVIPIVLNSMVVDTFSIISNTGYLGFDVSTSEDGEVSRVADLLRDKLASFSVQHFEQETMSFDTVNESEL